MHECLACYQVVEEPYTMREARIHVRHVRDLLKSLDPADAYNGVDCNSLSFLNVITQGDIMGRLSACSVDRLGFFPGSDYSIWPALIR